jgi:hypothetical protein
MQQNNFLKCNLRKTPISIGKHQLSTYKSTLLTFEPLDLSILCKGEIPIAIGMQRCKTPQTPQTFQTS